MHALIIIYLFHNALHLSPEDSITLIGALIVSLECSDESMHVVHNSRRISDLSAVHEQLGLEAL